MPNHRSINDQIEFEHNMEEQGAPVRPNAVRPASYIDLLKHNRKNQKIEGFDFDMDMFENLCDCWTPKDQFTLLLNCSTADLDRFSRIAYNMDFNQAYAVLTGIADMATRRAFKCLAHNGNPSAIKVVSEHFMGLSEMQQNAPNITIINDMGKGENDK